MNRERDGSTCGSWKKQEKIKEPKTQELGQWVGRVKNG